MPDADRDAALPLHLPPGLRHACLGCGRSCEDWSEIEVEPDTAARLRRLPLFNPRLEPAAAGEAPCQAGSRAPGQQLLRLVEGADGGHRCCFLDRDRRCAVHLAHGPEAKPATCRAFPYFFVDTPAGVFTGLSFACTAVLHDHGPPVAAQGPAVAEILGLASHRERRGRGLRLAPGQPLAWANYLRLERRLAALLDRGRTVEAGLLAQTDLLRREAGLEGPLDPRPSPRLRARILATVLDASGQPCHFAPPPPALAPPPAADLLRRWLAHRLFRKDLLRSGEVLFGHGLLLVELALAREWQPIAGLAEAVAQVERGLAVHSNLLARLEAEPRLWTEASRTFAAPRFAASLLAPAGA